ncbi:H-NS family nucleoid-associated regulatory protein, partial [Delftia tsuruhatensis]|uniref:H-NS family nucleoid-associated regulatory protein n=1 Tax=Delftia tsuruhatensis TaxID=180282 RepID=UPI002260BE5E
MTDYQTLLTQKAALEAQIAQAEAEAKAKAVTEARTLIQEHGLTAADVFPPAKSKGSVGAPKYRDPATGA